MNIPLILPDIVAAFAGITAILYFISFLKTKNYLDFGLIIPRLYVCGVYTWFAIFHNLSIETTRLWSRNGWALLLGTEILYQIIQLWRNRKAVLHAIRLVRK
jgi:hypothetical protein